MPLIVSIATIMSLLTQSPFATAEIAKDRVICSAFVHFPDEDKVERSPLKKVDFDPDWREVDLLQYGFGADYSYLTENAIGLIVYDNSSGRSASSTQGFRRIGQTNQYEAELKFYDRLSNGRPVIAGLQCNYEDLPRTL